MVVIDRNSSLKKHHDKLISELNKAHIKLNNVLASDKDEIQKINDG